MKCSLIIFLLLNINASFASITDTCKEERPLTQMVCANIVFPDMLCGNEENAIDYIARFSAAKRNYIIRMFQKSRKYYPKVTALLKKQGVPEEFWVLMALESAFEPKAVSKAGAVGFWQFMDPVAIEYGLKIPATEKMEKGILKNKKLHLLKNSSKKKVVDERMVFLKSTNAAARYLKDRSKNLNNKWLLIAASYNWGVGNVWNAMEKTGKKNPTFWDIKKYLPQETLSYVMNFITLIVIYHNFDQYVNGTLVFYDRPLLQNNAEPETIAGL